MTKTKLPRGAKTAFIKSHANMSAKEVVQAAAKEGIKLTEATVYNIRSVAKKSKGKKRPRRQTQGPAAGSGIRSRQRPSLGGCRRVLPGFWRNRIGSKSHPGN